MTQDGFAGEHHAGDALGREAMSEEARKAKAERQVNGGSAPLPKSAILSICDRLLGETGRRDHVFGWLRAPGAAVGEWLSVDAYYPGKRLVVICRDQPWMYEELYRQTVPAHGLRLLLFSPAELGADRSAAEQAISHMIGQHALFGPPATPAPPTRPAGRERLASFMKRGHQPRHPTQPPHHHQPTPPRQMTQSRQLQHSEQPTRPEPPSQPQQLEGSQGKRDPRTPGARMPEGVFSRAAASLASTPSVGELHPHREGPGQAAAMDRAARFVAARRSEAVRKPPAQRSQNGSTLAGTATGTRIATERPAIPSRPRPTATDQAHQFDQSRRAEPTPARAYGHRPRPQTEKSSLRVETVVVLAAILAVEVYLDVIKVVLGSGRVLLGFGIALDVCARALGTLAAGRAGSEKWAWVCAVGGTPAVAAFVLFRRSPSGPVEPAPLAGLLSLFAAGFVLLGLITWLLGA